MASMNEQRSIDSPRTETEGAAEQCQDYLLSDIDSAQAPAGRSDGNDQPPSQSDQHTPHASERASAEGRVTLAPRLSGSACIDATIFHRALNAWNAGHYRQCTFEDLSREEQDQVRTLAARLQREEHPCAQ